MTVLYTFSPNWFSLFLVSCFSLFSNNSAPLKVYIMTELAPFQMKQLINMANKFGEGYEIVVLPIDSKIFNETNNHKLYTKYALYRLLAPSLIEEDKILYLDTDTTIQNSLIDLFNLDMKDNLLAAVPDLGNTGETKRKIGFSNNDLYFNSGILLMNLKRFRELLLDKTMLKMVNNNKYYFPDQDILNIVAKNKIIPLENIYNYSIITKNLTEYSDRIKIIHYVGAKGYKWEERVFLKEVWKEWEQKYNIFIKTSSQE